MDICVARLIPNKCTSEKSTFDQLIRYLSMAHLSKYKVRQPTRQIIYVRIIDAGIRPTIDHLPMEASVLWVVLSWRLMNTDDVALFPC